MLGAMLENPPDELGVLDACNHLELPAAALTGLDLDCEHASQALHPRHTYGLRCRPGIAVYGQHPRNRLVYVDWIGKAPRFGREWATRIRPQQRGEESGLMDRPHARARRAEQSAVDGGHDFRRRAWRRRRHGV